MVAKFQAIHFAGVDSGDAGILHRNERRDWSQPARENGGLPRAQVVGDPLQPVKKIEV